MAATMCLQSILQLAHAQNTMRNVQPSLLVLVKRTENDADTLAVALAATACAEPCLSVAAISARVLLEMMTGALGAMCTAQPCSFDVAKMMFESVLVVPPCANPMALISVMPLVMPLVMMLVTIAISIHAFSKPFLSWQHWALLGPGTSLR